MEKLVQGAIGSSQLMEFVRFDAGKVLRMERGGQGPKVLRLLVGNPLLMNEMAKTVPEAASYAPVTILIEERADGSTFILGLDGEPHRSIRPREPGSSLGSQRSRRKD